MPHRLAAGPANFYYLYAREPVTINPDDSIANATATPLNTGWTLDGTTQTLPTKQVNNLAEGSYQYQLVVVNDPGGTYEANFYGNSVAFAIVRKAQIGDLRAFATRLAPGLPQGWTMVVILLG